MEQTKPNQSRGRWKLIAVLLVCASPLIFSYLTYYVIKPTGRTNYGALIDPRAHPIPALNTVGLDGKPLALEAYKGKWIMLQVAPGDCQQKCKDQLVAMRQLRLMQGKGMERIERVWLITDDTPLDTMLMRVIDGTQFLRVKPEAVQAWLPVEQGGRPYVPDRPAWQPDDALPQGCGPVEGQERYCQAAQSVGDRLSGDAIVFHGGAGGHWPAGGGLAAGDGLDVVGPEQISQAGLEHRVPDV